MGDILQEAKGRTITAKDGTVYNLAPFTLNTFANIEEAFNCEIEELGKILTKRQFSGFRKLLWVLLQEPKPDITLEESGAMIEINREQIISLIKLVSELFESLSA